ncbi:MAG: hypothetical protein GXO78_00985 [Calditrichaeota bacterium]|nr:hypothetical protein [Calditrichota bacterium]
MDIRWWRYPVLFPIARHKSQPVRGFSAGHLPHYINPNPEQSGTGFG